MTAEYEKGFLSMEEWKTIIYHIYDDEDAMELDSKILEYLRKKYENVPKQVSNKKLSREEMANLSKVKEDLRIEFKDFLKMVMEYQIKLRDRYLKNFVYIFKKVDEDNNGILSEEEFVKLIGDLGVYEDKVDENVERLLQALDPFNNKTITFSECVTVFSMEVISSVDNQGNEIKISLLDKIASDENIIGNFL